MKLTKLYLGIILAGCLTASILTAGCTGGNGLFSKTGDFPQPETGIDTWITAVNNHDYDRIYDLSPVSIRGQISRPAFIDAQRNNPLLAQGNVVNGYTILNKTVSGDNSNITAQLIVHMPARADQSERDIPLIIKFVEVFENGEWHVWTAAPF